MFIQAEDGIGGAQESRGLGDVDKRQPKGLGSPQIHLGVAQSGFGGGEGAKSLVKSLAGKTQILAGVLAGICGILAAFLRGIFLPNSFLKRSRK